MFQVDPKQPFAAFVNAMIGYAQYMPASALANQAAVAYSGDPLAGKNVAGRAWNDMTQVQQYICVFYDASGQAMPDNIGAVLDANAGPDLPWNYSYAKWAALGVLKLS